jgi:hypothetical protein
MVSRQILLAVISRHIILAAVETAAALSRLFHDSILLHQDNVADASRHCFPVVFEINQLAQLNGNVSEILFTAATNWLFMQMCPARHVSCTHHSFLHKP